MHARGPAPYMHVEQKKNRNVFSFSGCWGQTVMKERSVAESVPIMRNFIFIFFNGFGFNIAWTKHRLHQNWSFWKQFRFWTSLRAAASAGATLHEQKKAFSNFLSVRSQSRVFAKKNKE